MVQIPSAITTAATRISVTVGGDDFDPAALQSTLPVDTRAGATVAFTGTARADGDDFQTMTLEHYPGMTEKRLHATAEEAAQRWPLTDIVIHHRYGTMTAGTPIVCVITRSAHRRAAFEAADFIMDYLKTDAPFWKRESRTSGDNWVSAKDSDTAARRRWTPAQDPGDV